MNQVTDREIRQSRQTHEDTIDRQEEMIKLINKFRGGDIDAEELGTFPSLYAKAMLSQALVAVTKKKDDVVYHIQTLHALVLQLCDERKAVFKYDVDKLVVDEKDAWDIVYHVTQQRRPYALKEALKMSKEIPHWEPLGEAEA